MVRKHRNPARIESRSKHLLFAAISLALVVSCVGGQAPGTSQATLSAQDRLRTLANEYALSQAKQRPWHLKLEVTLSDKHQSVPVTGTVETWRSGEDERTEYSFGTTKESEVIVGGRAYRSGDDAITPDLAHAALDIALHAGPEEEAFTGTSPELRKEDPGKLKLDCLMMSVPTKRLGSAPLGLFPTYCVLPGTDSLVVRYDYGSQTVIVRKLGTFLGFRVPIEFELEDGECTASVKVSLLQTFVPNGDTFATSQLTLMPSPLSAPPRLLGGVTAANIIKKVAPVFPETARRNRTSGTVVLHAIISRTGHVYALRPISAPDPDLAVSAIAAVRQWTYKPYLLNGTPTAIETTIMVNYNISF